MVDLSLKNVTKRYGQTIAVNDVSIDVERGEWLSLLGPSGCGKTTTLRMVAGFIQPDGGSISIKGADVTDLPPYRRHTGMVFQNYALFPHLTVEKNIGYGLRIRGRPKDEIKRRVDAAIELVQLTGLGKRYPTRELSGGQQQRVALARALVVEPDILLLDEPLSNLDAKLRDELCVEMAELQRRLALTTLYVTHDQDEALSMSTRIAVMNNGCIEQVGTPKEIYERPASLFVADFIGKINRLRAVLLERAASGAVTVRLQGAGEGETIRLAGSVHPSEAGDVWIGVRPERLGLSARGKRAADGSVLPGIVRHVAFYGREIGYKIEIAGATVLNAVDRNLGQEAFAPGQPVDVRIAPQDCIPLR